MAGFELPVDGMGEVLPHDHPALQGATRMLRGVAPDHVVRDDNYGCQRLSSALFKNNPDRHGYLSFNSQFCIEERAEDPAGYMTDRGWLGVVSVTVANFRAFDPATQLGSEWKIGMVPLPNNIPPDPCHGAVWGSISKSRADQIRRASSWLVEIASVVLDETQLPRA